MTSLSPRRVVSMILISRLFSPEADSGILVQALGSGLFERIRLWVVAAAVPARAAWIVCQSTKAFGRVRVLIEGVEVAWLSFWGIVVKLPPARRGKKSLKSLIPAWVS